MAGVNTKMQREVSTTRLPAIATSERSPPLVAAGEMLLREMGFFDKK